MDKDKINKNKQIEYSKPEVGEDATKYGEFVSSYFAWVSLPEQKEKVEESPFPYWFRVAPKVRKDLTNSELLTIKKTT